MKVNFPAELNATAQFESKLQLWFAILRV